MWTSVPARYPLSDEPIRLTRPKGPRFWLFGNTDPDVAWIKIAGLGLLIVLAWGDVLLELTKFI
ncbi:MAG: hypothetical protein QF582_21925 [Alphaproteobacteria bacterium]|jgi:hypothetical protein|nr:hypothetical protein [Alphaproteobacteria bacterium]MDP6815889.1 hypothetical protein [Alphaproteobacteria bacterium]|tara:strand:- start:385 stop:576 length:192 start_codon:yes stop_codon:yes gene_type:complete